MADDTTFGGLSAKDGVLRRVLDGAPDAIFVADSGGHIILVNRQAEALFLCSRDALLGRPIEILIPERFRRRHVEHRATFFDDPKARRMGDRAGLYAVRHDGTEFPADISLSPVRAPDRTIVVLAVRDLTEAKKHEAAREALIKELEEAIAHVRQLSGLLPICAWCRRVRDDQGY